MAGRGKLPAVFVCENNLYSMGTPRVRSIPAKDLTDKEAGYDMARDRFEGHDVLEVKERIGKAVQRARDGGGPTLIEILTYRFRGHSMSDPGKYRTSEEVEQKKREHDPVRIAREKLLEGGVSEADVDALEAEVEEEVQDAVRFADESPPATEEAMYRYVLAPEGGSDA
mgnify:CR=1 FL=1